MKVTALERNLYFGNNKSGQPVDQKFLEYKGRIVDGEVVPVVSEKEDDLKYLPPPRSKHVLCFVKVNPKLSGEFKVDIVEKGERIVYLPHDDIEREDYPAVQEALDELDWCFRVYLIKDL